MNIALCTPFKPLDHPSLSGDVTIARDLAASLGELGHLVHPLPHYPAKTLWKRVSRWPGAWFAKRSMARYAIKSDCWLTYGTYYKVPDVFGPGGAKRAGIPYFLLQASYAANRGKSAATWPGYKLNKRAMLAADHVFCNRVNDLRGCAKILPPERYTHIKPGLPKGRFRRDEAARLQWREAWGAGETPVVITAAMMRPGVKTVGVRWVIEACAELVARGRDLKLVVAGDGPNRAELEALAAKTLGERAIFLGKVDRGRLGGVFSAGDLFAFPGLEESVGMVYLEAQACGLPVVATEDEGAPHVIAHERSGLITKVSPDAFTNGMDWLLTDSEYRRTLGAQAVGHVAAEHDALKNYRQMTDIMESITEQRKSA